MITSRCQILATLVAAACLLFTPSCALVKPAPSAPTITAGRATSQPSGLSARLRENFGVRDTAPTATAPSAGSAAPSTTTAPAPASVTNSVATPYKMRAGDTILIILRDLPNPRVPEQQIEDVIDDNGMVNLPLIGRMTAAGKTTSVFEQEVEEKYIKDEYYKRLTVNAVIPQRLIYVTGEVKISNKYPLTPGMTLSQAVGTAGGLTDFHDAKATQLIRGSVKTTYNLIEIQRDPSKDVYLEAGDQIVVPRSKW